MDNKVPDFVKRDDKSLNEKKLFILTEVNKNPDNFISENGLNHTLGYIKDWVPENIKEIKDAFTKEDTSDIPRVQEIIGKQLIMAYDSLKNTEAKDDDNFIVRMNKSLLDNIGARLFNLMENKWRIPANKEANKEDLPCCSKEVSFGVNNEGHLTFGNLIEGDAIKIPFSKYYEMVNKLYNQDDEDMEKPNWGTENNNKEEVKAFITQLSQNGGRKRKRRRKTKRKTKRKSKRKMKRKSKRKTKRKRKRKSKRRR